jgi:ABC-type phosphate/phosphonate transport system substrate-binding protein
MWLRNASRGGGAALLAGALTTLLIVSAAAVDGRQAPAAVLQIGTSGALGPKTGSTKEKAALETLKGFIKDETGMDNEIVGHLKWDELADKLTQKKFQIGVFQGYEFAWAQEKHPDLKPLTLAVNVQRYPVAYVVTKKDDPAKDFAGLQGKSLVLPAPGQRYLTLFVERQAKAAGKKPEEFFSRLTTHDNVEDVLDDVVDGVAQAAVVDRAALEAYKRRKPGRFNQLKEVAKSQPFPPVVVAYQDKALDEATFKRFRDGLLNANKKERGQMMLTLFRLTGFDPVPDDFDKVLAETRKAYPPEGGAE